MMPHNKEERIHFVGIKGSGMSALAQFFIHQGARVCGSDVSDEFPIDALLRAKHISVEQFSQEHITQDLNRVIYSTAWEQSGEVVRARELAILTESYPQAMARVFNARKSIAVCGSHGKSTTTAWLGYVLAELGSDPSVIVGSKVKQWDGNMRYGRSELCVFEADEYQDKLSMYEPWSALVTNVDYDHPDFFKTKESYIDVFTRFCKKITDGFLVACWDDAGVRAALADRALDTIIRYGSSELCDYSFQDYTVSGGKALYTITQYGRAVARIESSLPGRQNALNALAIYAFCDRAKYGTSEQIAHAICSFTGIARRFEQKGVFGRVVIIDDYAHHPTEIGATLDAARDMFDGKRIWCVFSPHTFSRTEMFKEGFAKSFLRADMALILDIFSSAREQDGAFHSSDLVSLIKEYGGNAYYVKDPSVAAAYIREHIQDIDVLLTLGADEVWKVWKNLLGM
jgi:UDP-N-acetylmuramate--alanine ligase